MFKRPKLEEFPAYTRNYIKLVPEGDIVDILTEQLDTTYNLLSQVTEDQADYRYEDGKWSLSEVLGHLTDTERIMAYRILRIARGDQNPLVGFDENEFVKKASFYERPMTDLLEDYQNVRTATTSLLKRPATTLVKIPEQCEWIRSYGETVAYMVAGHERHHLKIIEEKYL